VTLAGRLFQARMWREYAQTYDGRVIDREIRYPRGMRMRVRIDSRWVAEILRKSKAECLRLARVNLYLARRMNRKS
jgi:hypothetical protein